MNKSYQSVNPRVHHSLEHSTPLNQQVEELIEVFTFLIYFTTIKPENRSGIVEASSGLITGAKGVLQTCAAIIEMIQAKNVKQIKIYYFKV